jgi:hypothetical protein
MVSLHWLATLSNFASAAHISKTHFGDIIQHVGKPVGYEQVHDGGMSHNLLLSS